MLKRQFLIDFKKGINLDFTFFAGSKHFNNMTIPPELVDARDVYNILDKYLEKEINIKQLISWVNILRFTDYYIYSEDDSEIIANIFYELEMLDEYNDKKKQEQIINQQIHLLKKYLNRL